MTIQVEAPLGERFSHGKAVARAGTSSVWGLAKTTFQVLMTAMAYNLKRLVKLCPEDA